MSAKSWSPRKAGDLVSFPWKRMDGKIITLTGEILDTGPVSKGMRFVEVEDEKGKYSLHVHQSVMTKLMVNRNTPGSWVWAYHVTGEGLLPQIVKEGLAPSLHPSLEEEPILFVEPELEGVEPYIWDDTATLRFKTPGFGTTEGGESVLYGGSQGCAMALPDDPFVGAEGEDGVIPPERIEIMREGEWGWLIE